MHRKFGLSALVLCAALMLGSARANALCLLCSCSVASGGIDFGTYDPLFTSSKQGTGTITVSCGIISGLVGLVVSYDLKLSAGSSGTYTSRRMSRGSSRLNYNLYTDSARTKVWGDGTNGTEVVPASYLVALGAGTNRTFTVYGLIPLLQSVEKGVHNDSVVITIVY